MYRSADEPRLGRPHSLRAPSMHTPFQACWARLVSFPPLPALCSHSAWSKRMFAHLARQAKGARSLLEKRFVEGGEGMRPPSHLSPLLFAARVLVRFRGATSKGGPSWRTVRTSTTAACSSSCCCCACRPLRPASRHSPAGCATLYTTLRRTDQQRAGTTRAPYEARARARATGRA